MFADREQGHSLWEGGQCAESKYLFARSFLERQHTCSCLTFSTMIKKQSNLSESQAIKVFFYRLQARCGLKCTVSDFHFEHGVFFLQV